MKLSVPVVLVALAAYGLASPALEPRFETCVGYKKGHCKNSDPGACYFRNGHKACDNGKVSVGSVTNIRKCLMGCSARVTVIAAATRSARQ